LKKDTDPLPAECPVRIILPMMNGFGKYFKGLGLALLAE
jgi:hypothetical protein